MVKITVKTVLDNLRTYEYKSTKHVYVEDKPVMAKNVKVGQWMGEELVVAVQA